MSTYTKIKTLPLSLFNNAEYLSFMNHVLDLANGNSGGGDSESPDEISLRKSSKRPFILAVSCAMGRRAMPL